MQASSSTRLRTAFVPWLAALVIGASAHAGWLIHDLRDHHDDEESSFAHTRPMVGSIVGSIDVNVDVHELHIDGLDESSSEPTPRPMHERSSFAIPSRTAHCRHATRQPPATHQGSELDFWITRTGRYEYSVDPRMLARVEVASVVDERGAARDVALERLGQLLGVERGAGELRNKQRDSPLWHLGLRTGDRLLSIARPPGSEEVEVALARRGRALVLTYRVT